MKRRDRQLLREIAEETGRTVPQVQAFMELWKIADKRRWRREAAEPQPIPPSLRAHLDKLLATFLEESPCEQPDAKPSSLATAQTISVSVPAGARSSKPASSTARSAGGRSGMIPRKSVVGGT